MSMTRGCPLLVCAVLAALPGCGRQFVQAAGPAAVRGSVELTVYSDDFAQVAEVRPITLERGENHVPLAEVSYRLDPQSVLLRWSGGSAGPELVAETYDAGVSSAADVLRRYRGRQVEVVRYGENGREAERQSGTLVSGEYPPVVESNGRLYVGVPGTISAPVAGVVVTLPHLSVQVDSPTRHGGDLQLAYLTRGLSWSADYVATLSEKTKTMAVECWASVVNETGATYPSAHVTLVAGTPNRAALPARQRMAEPASPAPALAPVEKAGWNGKGTDVVFNQLAGGPAPLGELRSYAVSSPTTVAPGRMNRLRMFHSPAVPVKLDYAAFLPPLYAYDDYYWNTNT